MLSLILLAFIGSAVSEFDPEIHEKFMTLPKHEFVTYFNSLNRSWTIKDYGEDKIQMHFGAEIKLNHGLPTITHDKVNLPINFDARTQWPHCETIREINNQGGCGSCYLFGAINSASDRTCIHTGVHVRLSEQEGDCVKPMNACNGGSPSDVLQFWVQNGLVTKECKPYNEFELASSNCKQQCVNPSIQYSQDKHFGETVYHVNGDLDSISAEVVKNGPVVIAFKVYGDIHNYHGGVYEHSYGAFEGYHAVRLIGFGVDERGVDYWILANSWGPGFGEGGFIRVKRGQAALGVESFVFAGIPRRY
nr:chatepsin B [Ostrinia furnacalis]